MHNAELGVAVIINYVAIVAISYISNSLCERPLRYRDISSEIDIYLIVTNILTDML